jgi:hypothetical protein
MKKVKNMKTSPTDNNEVFVISITHKVYKNNKIKYFEFTTLRLLEYTKKN